MIDVRDLTKTYGATVAVDSLTFTVKPGRVTGFLGPNGAGKSTTMRLILGLDHPDAGTALIGGRPYRSYRHPLFEVGALLEARSTHPGRTAGAHLRWLVHTHGIGRTRVARVSALVQPTWSARLRNDPVRCASYGLRSNNRSVGDRPVDTLFIREPCPATTGSLPAAAFEYEV